MSEETTEPTDQTTEQPGDGTPVNEVPDSPTVVDPTGDPAPTAEQFEALAARVTELEEAETTPAPAAGGSNLVEWDDHDDNGNARTFYGVDLGPHPWEEGTRQVARLVPAVNGYAPERLRPLGS